MRSSLLFTIDSPTTGNVNDLGVSCSSHPEIKSIPDSSKWSFRICLYRDFHFRSHFRQPLELVEEGITFHNLVRESTRQMMGYWKIDKIAGYMPPWEAFLEFGIYQDFYLIHWQHPFQHVDYYSTENGSCAMAIFVSELWVETRQPGDMKRLYR